MILKTKIATAVATASLFATMMAPAAFADITVLGNGSGSNITVNATSNDSTNVSQNNSSNVTTNVNNNLNSGGNTANGNTGGSQEITTGDLNATTNIEVGGPTNAVTLPECGCQQSSPNIDVTGNGTNSKVNVHWKKSHSTSVGQNNSFHVNTGVTNTLKSGKNHTDNNTGGGSSTITSGMGTSMVDITVDGPSNIVH